MSQQQPSTADSSQQRSPDGYSRAWQMGYKCFKSHDHAKGNSLLQLLDALPQQFHKAALDGWSAAMSDHNAFRKD